MAKMPTSVPTVNRTAEAMRATAAAAAAVMQQAQLIPPAVLQSPTNPHGWQLHDLLEKVIDEFGGDIRASAHDQSPSAVAARAHNQAALVMLQQALRERQRALAVPPLTRR